MRNAVRVPLLWSLAAAAATTTTMSNHTTSEQRAFASSATATSTANDQQQQQQRQQQRRPLQVFVLAGQSNMVGMGSIEHMDLLVSSSNGTDSNIFRETLLSKTNQSSNDNNDSPPVYQERDDVIIQYDENHGKLTISRTAGFAGKNSFGPEVMFGWTVGDALAPSRKPRRNEDDDPTEPPPTIVWLIKTAWGGQSLAVDFRPPAAGEGTYAGVHPAQYGWLYRTMIATIQTALENIAQVVPQYDASVGYELAGLVWFQGWNDMLNWDTVTEYGPNLEKFIRDVRLDLNAPPTMPIVIGELGMHGLDPQGRAAPRVLAMRAAQHSVTLLDEFRNNTLFVRTAPYVVDNETSYNGQYHYNGRADTYFYMGQAMVEGMLQLMKNNREAAGESAIQSER